MGRVSAFAEVDAVTVDGFQTLVEFSGDVVARLHELVPDRPREEVERAAAVEFAYYREHADEARDDSTLAKLRADCAAVFSDAVGARVEPDRFMGAFEVVPVAGAVEAIRSLRARGLAVAVVSNWDIGLHEHLERVGLAPYFGTVVTSAEAGARKPDAKPFRLALDRLRVSADRAVHVGDHAPHDEAGAAAAGMRFAPAPLAAAFEGWA